jgi:hypothetical protein
MKNNNESSSTENNNQPYLKGDWNSISHSRLELGFQKCKNISLSDLNINSD